MFNNKCLICIYIFLTIYFGNYLAQCKLKLPRARTPLGPIVGYWKRAENGRIFGAFEGIPYAKPPIGELRFKEPQPLESWSGTWIANKTVKCLQYNHLNTTPDRVEGVENCLFLNIYIPRPVSPIYLMDVIVHIHGGGFTFGEGHSWSPNVLMEHNIIYVNLNYRLGPLGFLSTEDDTVPGNNGLKDQSMALKWIKDNIIHFGGNPESITLTGMSAGGASVLYHLISPMSKGLFNKAFAISGSCLNPWAQMEGALEKTKKLAVKVGCNTKVIDDMIQCLREKPGHEIVEKVKLFQEYLFLPFSPWAPVVEKNCSNAFLCQSPYKILKKGEVQDLPLMMSLVAAEGLYPGAEFLESSSYLPEIDNYWEELAPFILDYNYTIPLSEQPALAERIKKFYLDDELISLRTFPDLIQMMSDRLFTVTVEDTLKLLSQRKRKSRIYFHYTTYLGSTSTATSFSKQINNLGPSHADDVNYVLPVQKLEPTEENLAMRKIFVKLWLTFAKTGFPVLTDTEYEPVIYKNNTYNYLQIDSPKKLSMKRTETLAVSYNFWKSINFQENEKALNL